MAKFQRLAALFNRLPRPSTWRYLLLVASDPRYAPLFESLRKSQPNQRLRDPSLWFAWRAAPVVEQELASRIAPCVLEWGSGGSTRWLAQRAGKVISVEHHAEWFEVCKQHVDGAAEMLRLPEGPQYASPDIDYASLDVIIIDGIMRVQCAQTVAERITTGEIRKGTLVIFDNSERDAYREGIEALEAQCSRWRSYTGPTGIDIDQMTTLFWV